MVTNVALMNFSDHGVRTVKDTVRRSESAMRLAREFGVTFKSLHWTMGAYDLVAVLEGPDDSSLAAFALAITSMGNIRTQTLRAFSAEEMDGIVSRLP